MPLPFRLAFFYFAFFVCAGLWVAYLPPYLAARGLGAAQIAWVLALPQFVRIVAPSLWGWLADRSGAQRGIVAFSCAANVACFALLPHAAGFEAIAWLVAATSLLTAAALPLVEGITLGALSGEPGRYGPIRLWGSIGFIAAVLGGGVWLDLEPVETLPAMLFVASLATLAAASLLPAQRVHAAPAASRLELPPAAVALLGAGFCMALAHGALYVFFTLHLQREGYSGSMIGFLWTLGVLAEVGVFFYLPALFRRYPLSVILAASCACAVVRFLAIGWGAALLPLLLAAQLLHAATFGSFHAAAVAAVHRVFPPHAQARGQTLFSSLSYAAGGAVGALLAGWSWEASGPGLAFSLSALAGLAGFFLSCSLKSRLEMR
jgi:PPP family 3-phenylpropionic acid transporter